jgi:hypothetical protein
MTDHLTYSLPVPGPVKGCTRPQGQARDNIIIIIIINQYIYKFIYLLLFKVDYKAVVT